MRALVPILLLFPIAGVKAETGVEMLPNGSEYDAEIPKPAEVLGFEVGAQHARHDQLVAYFRALDDASGRVRLETIGRTHEGREQLLAVISTPGNLARLDEIRQRHLAAARGERDTGDGPVILWQGYSIHGDESSGSNAAMLYAWHLAASRDQTVANMLEEVIVLVDPSLNPDGMARFAAWATSQRGESVVADPAHREHNQPWPSGRGNHYWFDLNRDWLLLQHPESRNRVAVLNRWRPHVVTDHHEMGPESTYFFQPGVPERTHPLTSDRNQELTGRIAEFHARRLDGAGRLYYTRETYDDFYYGKGSTYPDITGGIGILFEQATTAGQAIDSPYGVRQFETSVENQLLTSLSTLEAAFELRDELKAYQAEFFDSARQQGDGAWVVGDAGNPGRMRDFLSVLAGHDIRFRPLAERIERDDQVFEPGHAWVVPVDQTDSRLIGALFESRTEFPSHVFYDVSAWTLPLAFDLPYARLGGVPEVGEWHDAAPSSGGGLEDARGVVAYAFSWHHDGAPPTLQALLESDAKALAATRPVTVDTPSGPVELERGAIVVPLGIQRARAEEIESVLGEAAREHGLIVHAALSSLTAESVDLGSPSLAPLSPIKPLLVTGKGVNPYEAGEVWHLADVRLGLPLTRVERARLAEVPLHDYTHVILVGGEYDSWTEETAVRLNQWIADGGILVAQQEAARWASDFRLDLPPKQRQLALEDADFDFAKARLREEMARGESKESPERRNYADYPDDFAETLVSGAIFEADVDITHPLAFGIPDRKLPVFRNRSEAFEASGGAHANVAVLSGNRQISGFASEESANELSGTTEVLARKVNRGTLIQFAGDPTFRGVWLGTSRMMVNSLYLAQSIRSTEMK